MSWLKKEKEFHWCRWGKEGDWHAARFNFFVLIGTFRVHAERTRKVKEIKEQRTGGVFCVNSRFTWLMDSPDNIRNKKDLEPLGALGDLVRTIFFFTNHHQMRLSKKQVGRHRSFFFPLTRCRDGTAWEESSLLLIMNSLSKYPEGGTTWMTKKKI